MWAAAVLFVLNLGHPIMITGASMAPALRSGDLLWLDRTAYVSADHPPRRGEVVVFQKDWRTYVKRVYRGPGERIGLIRFSGEVTGLIRESGIDWFRERYAGNRAVQIEDLRVPPAHVFVLGDNRQNSLDSRAFGFIPISSILGRVIGREDPEVATQFEMDPPRLPGPLVLLEDPAARMSG